MHSPKLARARSPIGGVYALTPDLSDTDNLCTRVGVALAAGIRLVQYRNKGCVTPDERFRQASLLRSLCSANAALLIINDDVDLAAAVRADGVHLGRDDAELHHARSVLGPGSIIGASCYDSLHRAEAAVAAGADYVAFGSFYGSAVKPDAVRAAPSLIGQAKRRWNVPVVAIGGINGANAAPLIAAGADAIAVVTALFEATDIAAAARRLLAVFDENVARAGPSPGSDAGTLRGT